MKLANRLKRRMVNPAKVVAEWLKKALSKSSAR